MPEEEKKLQVTKFDSSVSTLERIDKLIQKSHFCYLNWGCGVDNMNATDTRFAYLDINDCVYTEVHRSLTPEEEKDDNDNKEEINKAKKKYGHELSYPKRKPRVSGVAYEPNGVVPNESYENGWLELRLLGKKRFIHLMGCLDAHGMLMQKKKIEDEEEDL